MLYGTDYGGYIMSIRLEQIALQLKLHSALVSKFHFSIFILLDIKSSSSQGIHTIVFLNHTFSLNITIIIVTFIQYMQQFKKYKSHKNGLLAPGKYIKYINKVSNKSW